MGKPQANGNLEKVANALNQAHKAKVENLTWYIGQKVPFILTAFEDIASQESYLSTPTISLWGMVAVFDDALGENIVELRGDNFSAVIELDPHGTQFQEYIIEPPEEYYHGAPWKPDRSK